MSLPHYAKVIGGTSIAAPIAIAVAQAFLGTSINSTQLVEAAISADIIMSVLASLSYEK